MSTEAVPTMISDALTRMSLRAVARALGISCESVLRLAARRPVHNGTLLLATTNLAKLASKEAA